MTSIDKVLLNAETHDEFIRSLMSSMIFATKLSNQLPESQDYAYAKLFQKFSLEIKNCELSLQTRLLELLKFIERGADKSIPYELSDNFMYDQTLELIDILMHNAHISLDQFYGKNDQSKLQFSTKQFLSLDKLRILHSNTQHEMEKPQKYFNDVIDNSRENPFYPKIAIKYHSKYDLNIIKCSTKDLIFSDTIACYDHYYSHPYERELLELSYQSEQMKDATNLQPSLPLLHDEMEFTFVETEEAFTKLLEDLSISKEIAVDLENHSVRSFQGFTCICQISTRNKDYLIDTIKLRWHMSKLGSVFANPAIVKVFHGANNDVLWLQRDFGLYVVNCFDTYYAAKALNYPSVSLAHLLKHYCHVTVNKKHQLSDWRIRKLPDEMIRYARDDTHYLLYIYDCIRKDLWRNFGEEGYASVLELSRKGCLNRYEKEVFQPNGFRQLIIRKQSYQSENQSTTQIKIDELTKEQDAVLSALWNWRDKKARDEDESLQYVMANSELLRIGIAVPKTQDEFKAQCFPLSSITMSCMEELLKIIHEEINGTGSYIIHSDFNKEVGNSKSQMNSETRQNSTGNSEDFFGNVGYTFIPVILPPSISISISPHKSMGGILNSPVLNSDEIFAMAGWRTPAASISQTSSSVDLPNQVSPTLIRSVSDPRKRSGFSNNMPTDSKVLPTKANCESDVNLIQDKVKMLAEINDSPTATAESKNLHLMKTAIKNDENLKVQNSSAITNEAEKVEATPNISEKADELFYLDADHNMISMKDIPKSYEEIYQISVHNKKRNKEKKRTRDLNELQVQSDTQNNSVVGRVELSKALPIESNRVATAETTIIHPKAPSLDMYFPSTPFNNNLEGVSDIGVEGTVTMKIAHELGWITTNEEYNEMKEIHNRFVHTSQMDSEEQPLHFENQTQISNATSGGNTNPVKNLHLRKSIDKPLPSNDLGYSKMLNQHIAHSIGAFPHRYSDVDDEKANNINKLQSQSNSNQKQTFPNFQNGTVKQGNSKVKPKTSHTNPYLSSSRDKGINK